MVSVSNKRLRKGFSLIEAAIVLGIVGLVIGGIWVAASAVQTNLRESTASQGVLQIVQNVRNLYYGQSLTATADIDADLVSAGAIPGDLLQGTNPRNPWNGAIDIDIVGASFDQFSVAFPSVPRDSCVELISRNTNLSTGIGLVSIAVDDGTPTTILAAAMPITPTTAVTTCGNASSNTITWTFNLRG